MTKKELRKKYLNKRKALLSEEISADSALIVSRLKTEFYLEGKTIHFFLPIEKFQEVKLTELLSLKNTNFCVPVSDFKTNSMKNIELKNLENISVNNYGIPEPTVGKEIISNKIDIIICPLLAFDLKGNRLGYGKGFYDKFLSNIQAIKIGVSLFEAEQLLPEVSRVDIPLDYCITPSNIYHF